MGEFEDGSVDVLTKGDNNRVDDRGLLLLTQGPTLATHFSTARTASKPGLSLGSCAQHRGTIARKAFGQSAGECLQMSGRLPLLTATATATGSSPDPSNGMRRHRS